MPITASDLRFFCSPLKACTDEELELKLAQVPAYASRGTLNDVEVQKLHQLYEEILRRALAVTAA
jgi:hypothetical protein